MRLNVYDAASPDPYRRALFNRALILFNGRPVSFVINADEETGFIQRYTGAWEQKGGYLNTEILRGVVRIVDPLEPEYLAEVYLK